MVSNHGPAHGPHFLLLLYSFIIANYYYKVVGKSMETRQHSNIQQQEHAPVAAATTAASTED
jgi:hypothetical protein